MNKLYTLSYLILVLLILSLPASFVLASLFSNWITLPKNKQFTKAPYEANRSEFVSEIENRLENAIPYRDLLNKKYKTFSSVILKQSNENVVVGSDDWLFYTGDDIFEDLMGLRKFSNQELVEWFAPYIEKESYLRSKGIKYLLVIIPNKSTVYKEKLPWWVKLNLRATRMDQILEAKEQLAPNLDILDLSGTMSLLKKEGKESFWYNDTHWSGDAFLISLSMIFDRVQYLLPAHDLVTSLDSYSLETFEADGDLVNLIGLSGEWLIRPRKRLVFTKPEDMKSQSPSLFDIEFDANSPSFTHPVVIKRDSKTARALIFHDSFLKVAKPSNETVQNNPAALPFGTSIHIGEHPTLERIKSLVEKTRPDIVIEERVERKLIEGNLK